MPVERVALSTRVSAERARQGALVGVLHPVHLEVFQFAKFAPTARIFARHATVGAVSGFAE